METTACPGCGGEMHERPTGGVTVLQCGSCEGVFLQRGDLGRLVEAENDWHAHSSTDTAQLPRITADMTAPPARPRARSYLDSLFRG
jgi:Zn-finger nucleic acid-binding protein